MRSVGTSRRADRDGRAPDLVPEPPHDPEAEEYVLEATTLSPHAITAVRAILSRGDFYRDSHARIFHAAVELHDSGSPVDAIILADELERRGMPEDGGKERIREIVVLVPATSNAAHYARIVRKKARARRDLEALDGATAAILNGGLDVVARRELVAELAEPEFGAEDIERARTSWEPLDLIAQGAAEPEPPTIGGLVYPGRRHLFSAEPEGLKSWLALILCALEIAQDKTVLYVDLEMSAGEVLARLRALGVDDEAIATRFLYVAPVVPLGGRRWPI